jgi:deaminated glutathione amidase
MTAPLHVAAVQLTSTTDVRANLDRALALTREAADRGARFIVLPENFGFFPGNDTDKLSHAQSVDDGPFTLALRALARERGVHILAGSIPERGPDAARTYNTSVLIGPKGETLAAYRKIHLFDVELAGGLTYFESAAVAPGDTPVTAEVEGWSVGLSVCYDLRFPELYRRLSAAGARILVIPAAFTQHTGKDHWEPLIRARAIENLAFVVAAGQWGQHGPRRFTWGKSMLVDPWGTTVAKASEGEGVVDGYFDQALQEKIRAEIPALQHRRL